MFCSPDLSAARLSARFRCANTNDSCSQHDDHEIYVDNHVLVKRAVVAELGNGVRAWWKVCKKCHRLLISSSGGGEMTIATAQQPIASVTVGLKVRNREHTHLTLTNSAHLHPSFNGFITRCRRGYPSCVRYVSH